MLLGTAETRETKHTAVIGLLDKAPGRTWEMRVTNPSPLTEWRRFLWVTGDRPAEGARDLGELVDP